MTHRDRPKSGPKSFRQVKIWLAAPEKGGIGQEGGKNSVSGAQTRGKTVFDGAELDFDSFSGSWKCWVGHLAITPSREAIFSLGRPYFQG